MTLSRTCARVVAVFLAALTGGPMARSEIAAFVSQFGITWTFDKGYPVGQYANGDYWVVGPVRIDAISPATTQLGERRAFV